MSREAPRAAAFERPAVAAGWLTLFTALPAWDVLLGRGVYWAHDLRHHYHPWRHWAAGRWARGEVPLWAADVGAGAPLMADGQVGALYPVNVLLGLLLPSHFALSAGILLHAWWAALGGWFLARSLGRSGAASLLAGILIGGGGFMVGHLTYAGMHAVAAWAPWAFAFALRLGRGEARWAPAFGVAVACSLLAGHVQVAAISLLGALLVFLAQRPGIRAMGWAGGGAALGLGAASAQLAASLELARLSARSGGVDGAFARVGALPPQELLNLAFPRLWGWERPADIALSYMHKGPLYYGTGEAHWEGLIYVGLPALLLAGATLRARAARGWWALAGAAVALMLATPAWDLLRLAPGFTYFRFPARFGLWLSVALAMLAALGLDRALEVAGTSNPSASRRTSRLALGAFGLVVGGGLLARLALLAVEPMARGALLGALGGRPGGPERAEAILSGLAWSGTWGLVLPGLSLLALAALAREGGARMQRGVALLVALDLTLTLWGYNPRVAPELASEPPWTAAYAAQPGLDRASVVDRVQPVALDRPLISSALGLVWGTRDVILTSPLRLPRHESLLAAAGLDVGLDHGPAKAATLMQRLELASMLGVRQLLTVHQLQHARLVERAAGADGVRVYENLDAMHRARFVPCAVAVDGPEAALARLIAEGPRQAVFVEDHDPAACRPRAPGRARVRYYADEAVIVDVDAPQGGYLLLADLSYPGWQVEVDGAPAELLQANVSLRAVRLPAGAEQVRFVYRPAWAWLLPWSAASGLALLLGLGALRRR